MQPWWHLARL